MNLIVSWWTAVAGQKSRFSLEARIFHAVILIAIFTAVVNTVVNFSIGLTIYGFLMIAMIGVLFFGYYLSRFKDKLHIAVSIFAVAFNLLCGATYFSSEGSGSVNLFTFILIIFLLSFLSTKKQFRIGVPLTIFLVAGLFALEFFYPQLVQPLYATRRYKLIDIAQTWLEVAAMIAIITVYIRENYIREKELAKSRLMEVEELNDTKNKLFSIIAHDLRAPLATIENYLTVLNEANLLPDEKKSIEHHLLLTTRQTSAMLQNILYWSKDQMLGISVKLNTINLLETLKPTILLQQSLAREKGIYLEFTIAHSVYIIADADMLELIVRNLLHNAIKFSLPGGKISLQARQNADTCILEVKDTGIGIENQDDNIFSLNYKGRHGTNREKGVGLGLMLAKHYIELQHGAIWYKSEPGAGTSFFIRLPLSQTVNL